MSEKKNQYLDGALHNNNVTLHNNKCKVYLPIPNLLIWE